jgi:PAS domain S-box-containing protein
MRIRPISDATKNPRCIAYSFLLSPALSVVDETRAPARFRRQLSERRLAVSRSATGVLMAIALALLWAATARSAPGWEIADIWTQKQGLPQNMVYAVQQTKDGYLWTGTRGGVSRFDGVSFTTFDDRKEGQLKELEVWAMLAASDDSIWIGTFAGGVTRLKDGKFTTFTPADGLPSNIITAFAEDKTGAIWIGGNEGITRFQDGKFTHYATPNIAGSVKTFLADRDGSLWFGTTKGEINRLVDGRFVPPVIEGQIPSWEIRAIIRGRDGTVWIGSFNGVFRLRETSSNHYEVERVSAERIYSLLEDAEGNVWAGTDSGLDRYVPAENAFRNECQPSHADPVLSICQDHEGSLWLGLRSRGLARVRRSLFRSFTRADGLLDESILTTVPGRGGRVWVGAAKGLQCYFDGKFVVFAEDAGLPRRPVEALLEDRAGYLWIGTVVGLYRSLAPSDDVNWLANPRFAEVPHGSARTISARCIYEDGAGDVWVGTVEDGLFRYHAGEFTNYTTKDGLAHNAVRELVEDREGNLWAATREGLNRFRDGKFTTFTTAEGLASNQTISLHLDREGALWVGTRYGVSRFKDGHFVTFTVKDGLMANYVYNFTEDNLGNIWMTCSKGIFRVSRAQLDDFAAGRISSIETVSFGREHGLVSTSLPAGYSPSAALGSDGKLWFALFGGVAVVDPADLAHNPLPPPVHIAGVIINGHEHVDGDGMSIPAGRGDLEFHYTGLSFLAPEKMRFKYQLVGYDRDWIDPGSRRAAYYSNIAPGDYVFRVMASNNDGVWNEAAASFRFTLRPHFYETTWFYAAMVAAAAGIAIGIFRLRVRHVQRRAEELQRQNEELERRVSERTAALADRSAELAKSYETLHASEYFYHSLVESLPQSILRKDAKGVYTYANSAFAELHGRALADIIGKTDDDIYSPDQAVRFRSDDTRIMQTRQPMEYERMIEKDGAKRYLHVKKVPLHDDQGNAIGVQVLFWDMTVFRETEAQLRAAEKELIEASRLAGMAEVATGVLHNIGNVLNTVNTSASLVTTNARNLRIPSISKVAQLLVSQGDRLTEFFATDPRAQKLPAFLTQLAENLEGERGDLLREVQNLRTSVDHIKDIVAAQQSYARVAGHTELIPPAQLVELALGISEMSLARHSITVIREFMPVPAISVQRQKALQILINLLNNAKDAMSAVEGDAKQLVLGVRQGANGMVRITVTDSGHGISEGNLTRIFAFGFTTKKTGHGFGLHSSALAAKEMGGSLSAFSNGTGAGATFVLELPQSAEVAPGEATVGPTIDAAKEELAAVR